MITPDLPTRQISRTVGFLHEWSWKVLKARPTHRSLDALGFVHLLVLAFATSLFFVATDPAITEDKKLIFKLAFWNTSILTALVVLAGFSSALRQQPPLIRWGAGILPATMATMLVGWAFHFGTDGTAGWQRLWNNLAEITLNHMVFILPQVAFLWSFYWLAIWLWSKQDQANRRQTEASQATRLHRPQFDPNHPLIAKLRPDLGLDVVAASSEGHYLRVRTLKGEDLVLAQKADLCDALPGEPWCLIHRSHLINLRHTRQLKDGYLIMTTGLRLPISRRAMPDVRDQLRAWSTSQSRVSDHAA